ncbi:hypothetical protein IGI95_000740 [Enterococcus sp. DIV0784]|nr:hypothetical protein [Enterococcus faecalis]RBR75435.1 hypothetical protein EB46_01241 [Enterococcus faecalis]
MEKPQYLEQNVGTCMFHVSFGAWVPLMTMCGWAMVAA